MRKILVISPDKPFLKELNRVLEHSGFSISLSGSLEESFCEVNQKEPFLVIVDTAAVPPELWQAQRLLKWFHHRSKVLLLCDDQSLPQCEYDFCLPKTIRKDRLRTWIEQLG